MSWPKSHSHLNNCVEKPSRGSSPTARRRWHRRSRAGASKSWSRTWARWRPPPRSSSPSGTSGRTWLAQPCRRPNRLWRSSRKRSGFRKLVGWFHPTAHFFLNMGQSRPLLFIFYCKAFNNNDSQTGNSFPHLCQVVFAFRAYLSSREGVLDRCHQPNRALTSISVS